MKKESNVKFLLLIILITVVSTSEQIINFYFEACIHNETDKNALFYALEKGSLFYISVILSFTAFLEAFTTSIFNTSLLKFVLLMGIIPPIIVFAIHFNYLIAMKDADTFYINSQVISFLFSLCLCTVVYWRLYYTDSLNLLNYEK